MNSTTFLKSSLACALTLGMGSIAFTAFAGPSEMTPPQKTDAMMAKLHYAPCYGVNAAYKNDCVSPGHSCAGQDSKAHDPAGFVAMPAGLCAKIGGSLKSA